MSRYRKVCAVMSLVLGLTAASAARASDAEKRFSIKGVGIAPCSAFIKSYDERSQDALMFAGWLGGYMTAMNQELPETFDLAPWQSVEVLMLLTRDLCGRNPEEKVYRAAGALVRILSADRLTTYSEFVETVNGEHKTGVPKEVLRRIQERLKALNHYSGNPDGAYGSGTRKAIEAFQKQANVPVTGVPDQQTLVKLFYQSPQQQ